jgi:low affinity Fe/Cu permease
MRIQDTESDKRGDYAISLIRQRRRLGYPPSMNRLFTAAATRIAIWAGQPLAFGTAFLLILTWIVTGPLFGWSDTWQLVVNTATTIVTFLMVFLIQNSQNRDAAAIQAKLDELIRAGDRARNEFIGIEHLTDREIETIRRRLEDQVANHDAGHRRSDSVRRLLHRR